LYHRVFVLVEGSNEYNLTAAVLGPEPAADRFH
jgi:hypothetical protein